MSLRSVIVVLLALVCGGSAAFGVSLLAQPTTGAPAPVETVAVVVCKEGISRGRMVTADLLELKQWPKDYVPVGCLAKLEDAQERSALQPMLPGEPLLEGKLAPKEAGRGMAALIPNGMRAYTIQTSRVASHVAGFILPGNRVDVLLTLRGNPNDENGGGTTSTLLQSIEILAVGARIDAPASNHLEAKEADSVTLLVTPEQAARLDLGQTIGQLTLSLRNPDDTAESEANPATVKDIRFSQMKPEEVAVAAPVPMPEPTPPPVPAPASEPVVTVSHEVKARPVPRVATLRGQSWGEVRLIPAYAE